MLARWQASTVQTSWLVGAGWLVHRQTLHLACCCCSWRDAKPHDERLNSPHCISIVGAPTVVPAVVARCPTDHLPPSLAPPPTTAPAHLGMPAAGRRPRAGARRLAGEKKNLILAYATTMGLESSIMRSDLQDSRAAKKKQSGVSVRAAKLQVYDLDRHLAEYVPGTGPSVNPAARGAIRVFRMEPGSWHSRAKRT
jgi:hypothetical protein